MDLPFYREYDLPWTSSSDQERKFQRLLGAIFLLVGILGLVWPFIPTPEPDPYEIEDIPPRFARLLLEDKPLPPPPPVEKEPEPDALDPQKVVEKVPEPEPVPEPEIDRTAVAREQARAALLPFAADLADLVDRDLLTKVADNRTLSTAVGQSQRTERSMITSKVGTASSGINTSNMNRDTGGTDMAGRSTTKVASPVAGIAANAGGARRTGTSGRAPGLRRTPAAPAARARAVGHRVRGRKSSSYSTRTKGRYSRSTIVPCVAIRRSRASSYCA